MFPIDTPTAVGIRPAAQVAGAPGWFNQAPPGSGETPTVVSSDWCNGIQGELLAILAAAGIEADKTASDQVLTAIQTLIADAGAVTFATAAEIRARNNTKPVNASGLFAAAATVALVDQATLVWDIATHGFAPSITPGGNRTLGAITGLQDNDILSLMIVQDATGGRTLSYDSQHDFGADGAPTFSTAAGKVDFLEGRYKAATGKVHWNFRRAA